MKLSVNDGTRTFDSTQQLLDWAERENITWRDLMASLDRNDAQLRNIVSKIADHARLLHTGITRVMSEKLEGEEFESRIGAQLTAFSAAADATYATYIASDSREGGYVLDLARHDPNGAGYSLAFFSGAKSPLSSWPFHGLAAMIRASHFSEGRATELDAEVTTLTKLIGDWRTNFENTHGKLSDATTSAENTASEMADLRIDLEEKSSVKLNEVEKKLEALIERFHKKIQLQSSTKYWRSRASWALGGSILWGVVAIIASVSFIGFFAFLAVNAPDINGDPSALAYHYLTLLVIATIAVGTLRVIAKVFISQLQNRSDATERSTLINSYLALKEDAGGDDLGSDSALLELIFRPGDSGLIAGDHRISAIDFRTIALAMRGGQGGQS